MKCYWTYDPKTLKKVFIPMCYGSIIRNKCCCADPLTAHHFEKERFNEAIAEKNRTIEAMQAEIKNLNKVILILKKK